MSLEITVNGKSEYVIAASEDQIPSEITASKELQTYIAKSTGATLPIVNESDIKPDAPAILVGRTDFAKSAGLIPDGEEQWVIKTIGNRLVLTGGRPRGTLYAVYHFLEDHLGVRWWTIWDETVPNHSSLSIADTDRSGEPGFAYRDIYDAEVPWPKEFYARNRVNGHFSFVPWEYGGTIQYGPPHHVHTFDHYFHPDEYYDTHPEYFSLSKGERIRNGQLCLTNKDVFKEWIAKMKEYIKTSYAEADSKGEPRPVFFSISQNDWEGSCECDCCKAIYEKENHSGLSLMFVNAVAAEIEKEYPEVLIDTLAYWFYEEAPNSIKPRDNVRIRVCDFGEDVMHPITHENNKQGLRRLGEWAKITKHTNIWKYGVIYSPNLPIPSQLDYAEDVKAYKANGVEGVFIELENIMTTDMWEMKAWMLAKLYEDPYANSEALVNDFTNGYYGPAGLYIREYLNATHDALQKTPSYINFGGTASKYSYITYDLIRTCNAIFEKAEAAVLGDEFLLDRVRMARTSVDRAICYRTKDLVNEYENGGSKGDFGLSVEVSSKRASAILRKISDLRFGDCQKHARDGYDQAGVLEMVSSLPVSVPLPEQFAAMPKDNVFDFSPKDFRLVGPIVVKDPGADFGAAAKLDYVMSGSDAAKFIVSETEGMPMGLCNVSEHVFGETRYIKQGDIKPGYTYYKLNKAKFHPSEYFNMFWDWTLQLDLTPTMNENLDQEYEIYASIKFEGPLFSNGEPANTNGIYVERIIVVRV